MWRYHGQQRPPFAVEPVPGQESVWDYPRPPRLVADKRHVVVRYRDELIADSSRTMRVLETASPPTFYIPPDDVRMELLVRGSGASLCEWKGVATYWSVQLPAALLKNVGWNYQAPRSEFADIADYISFYPARVECYVDDERVQPQPGEFYGGWVTHEVVGPVKGEAGSAGW